MTLLELHKGTLFSCPEDILALAAGGSPCLGILSLMGILPPTSIHYDFLYFSCALAEIFPFYARKALFFFLYFQIGAAHLCFFTSVAHRTVSGFSLWSLPTWERLSGETAESLNNERCPHCRGTRMGLVVPLSHVQLSS